MILRTKINVSSGASGENKTSKPGSTEHDKKQENVAKHNMRLYFLYSDDIFTWLVNSVFWIYYAIPEFWKYVFLTL